ncbi:MAG TPA: YvcK family protein [Methylomusa anaerophila]|uniref:Putative gluconeogenesis factor n=1 Tax=Methylomusa anaerophila TaxID=1930071 RepID=A0A348AL09_9FIRM|nr:gluconeogenesis factor YvcK family protein [Methylomusa anaerophila]BBB91757.1 gluconeogenesis factor [Methylomusa anaerophila]HML88506.1 YvcK family protein [Methylomusa anaerophila]
MHILKWLYPGMKFKRWLLLFSLGVILVSMGLAMIFNYKYIGVIEESIFRLFYLTTGKYYYAVTALAGIAIIVGGVAVMLLATRQIIHSVISVLVPEGSEKLVEIIFQKRRLNRGPALAVVGGGTGLSVLLRGLKSITSNLTAIVTVADDGGSSGRLRKDLGIVPPGDLRNCLVALADTEPLMEKLFQHRFGGCGELAGHSFGNLYIAAMTEIVGDVELALKESSKVLAVRGQVLPATAERIRLVAEMADGTRVEGESQIPLANKQIKRVFIQPADAVPVKGVLEAIKEVDACILGPGSLYTSVLPNLMVKGVVEALRATEAVKIYICNVMTQPGETDGYTASQHVKAIIDHIGPGCIDYVVVNVQQVAPELQEVYGQQGAYPVIADLAEIEALGVKIVQANLISETNLVRHDPIRLSRTIIKLVYDLKVNSDRMRLLDYYLIAETIKKWKE